MIYLIDANVLITAHNTYYPVDRVPEFWDWLLHQAKAGVVKMPIEVFEEVMEGSGDEEKDQLLAWLKGEGVKAALVLEGEANIALGSAGSSDRLRRGPRRHRTGDGRTRPIFDRSWLGRASVQDGGVQ